MNTKNNPEGIKAMVADHVRVLESMRGWRMPPGEGAKINAALNAAIESLTAVAGDAEPANLGEFVIALLIAGGYVTQGKVDEARKIALSCGPYEMPESQAGGAEVVPKVQATAPERIWLTVADDKHYADEPFPHGVEEICWSHDQPLEVCVPYVRADLVTRQAVEGMVPDKAAVEALVAGPFMHHHKMNELQEREAKGFDRCRELTLKNIEIFFATRAAMLAAAAPQAGEGDGRG